MKKILLLFVFNYIFLVVAAQPEPVQNAGIGINNPTRAKLEVHGAVGSTSAIFGGETTGISIQRLNPGIGFNHYYNGASKWIGNGYAAIQYLNATGGYMEFVMLPNGLANNTMTGSNLALSINNNGNIGIRANAVNASLYAIKTGNFDGSAVFGGTNYNSHFHYSGTEDTYIRAGKRGSNVYINDVVNLSRIIIGSGTSYVGINTSNPSYALEIRQTGATGLILVEPAQSFNNWEQVVGLYDGGPQSSLKLIYNGQLKCFFRPTDGEFITSSDRRLKTNIRPLPFILDKIMQLRPVQYEMRYDNPGHEKTNGFIAQEVKKLFPEMVTISSNTVAKGVTISDFHALDYNAFKILAVKGVQEEQHLISNLQREQTEIIRRLEELEKKLAIKNQQK